MSRVNPGSCLGWAAIAGICAIVLSPLVTVLSGSPNFSALALLPITVVIWLITRVSRADLGLRIGRAGHYGVAVLYPILVMGILVLLIALSEGIQTSDVDPGRIMFVIAVNSAVGIIAGLLTEEGLFRGLIWGLLKTGGQRPARVLLYTSAVFAVWHVPVVLLEFGQDFPRTAIPIYLANVVLIGLNWGLMRMVSGSIVVAAVSHSVWNALAYKFFGFGSEYGVLETSSFQIFGPERGILGLALNLVFFIVFWRVIARRRP